MFHCSGSSLAFSVETGGDEMSEAEMRKRACLVNARQGACTPRSESSTHTHRHTDRIDSDRQAEGLAADPGLHLAASDSVGKDSRHMSVSVRDPPKGI